MRKIIVIMIAGIAISAIGLLGADNSIGTWKRNVAKSKYQSTPANPITSLTMVREASEGGVKSTVTGQRKDGAAVNSTYTAKFDGKEYPVTGAPWNTISIKQINANTFTTEARKTGGKDHNTGRIVISKDGKTMTLTNKGTDADGKPAKNKIVYEKQ